MRITIFENSYDITKPFIITVDEAIDRIRQGKSRALIEEIRRKTALGEDVSSEKKSLPSVVFAGVCDKAVEKTYKSGAKKGQKYWSYREDDSCTVHSGFAVLDFDKKDVDATKEILKKDPYVYAAWTSPRGNGVKALYRIAPDIERHPLIYNAIIQRYPELDTSSRNISRLCFESFDPDVYVNEKAEVFAETISDHKARAEHVASKNNDFEKNIISKSMARVMLADDGEKHNTIRNEARLLGGYIASGVVNELRAVESLKMAALQAGFNDLDVKEKAILDGIDNGKSTPIREIRREQRKAQMALKRKYGNTFEFDFLANTDACKDYIRRFYGGEIEPGQGILIPRVDQHLRAKKNTLALYGGLDGSGKTSLVLYLATLNAMIHGNKFLIYSAENQDASIRRKVREFYLGKRPQNPMDEEAADDFFDSYFKIISSSKSVYSASELIDMAELVYEEGWKYSFFIIDPYNSLSIDSGMSKHDYNYQVLSEFRVFTQNYGSVWLCAHAVTEAARNTDKDGYVIRPHKAAIEGGQPFANRVDDLFMIHRLYNHPDRRFICELYVDKIKDTDTGGLPTTLEEKLEFHMIPGSCGFVIEGIDPVEHFRSMSAEKITPNTGWEYSDNF